MSDRFVFNSSVVCRFKHFLITPLLEVRVGISTAATIFFTPVSRFSLDGVFIIMLSPDCVADTLLSDELTMISSQVAVGEPGQAGVVGWRRLKSSFGYRKDNEQNKRVGGKGGTVTCAGRLLIAKVMGRTEGVVEYKRATTYHHEDHELHSKSVV